MKKIVAKLFKIFAGKKKFQFFFEPLLVVALRGMHYGSGARFNESGEIHILRFIKDKLRDYNLVTILDGGGNSGKYAKALAEIFSTQAVIHSFEPSKKTFEIFLNTTKGIVNIIPNNFGLSDRVSTQLLYTNVDGSGLASVYKRNLAHFGDSMDKSESIQLYTIDQYCKDNHIEHIHFLKLDIEGHEVSALHGAKNMLDNSAIDFIQFEFGGCNIDSRTYYQDFYYLLKDKYKIYRILRDGIIEMKGYKETYEIFFTANFLAVKRNF